MKASEIRKFDDNGLVEVKDEAENVEAEVIADEN